VTAWEAGADAVKVFPCSAVGGAKYLKAIKAPLPQIELIPTGGVSLATAAEFLELGRLRWGLAGIWWITRRFGRESRKLLRRMRGSIWRLWRRIK
jgi:2-keto-3-deoxy-6-phosphogluconate aldolase